MKRRRPNWSNLGAVLVVSVPAVGMIVPVSGMELDRHRYVRRSLQSFSRPLKKGISVGEGDNLIQGSLFRQKQVEYDDGIAPIPPSSLGFNFPSLVMIDFPSQSPTALPLSTTAPSPKPPTTSRPTTRQPTTPRPTTQQPTTAKPSPCPSSSPSVTPPTPPPTILPTRRPTVAPTTAPPITAAPSPSPTLVASQTPSVVPSILPSLLPSSVPTTEQPSLAPSSPQTSKPSRTPIQPSLKPSEDFTPSSYPSFSLSPSSPMQTPPISSPIDAIVMTPFEVSLAYDQALNETEKAKAANELQIVVADYLMQELADNNFGDATLEGFDLNVNPKSASTRQSRRFLRDSTENMNHGQVYTYHVDGIHQRKLLRYLQQNEVEVYTYNVDGAADFNANEGAIIDTNVLARSVDESVNQIFNRPQGQEQFSQYVKSHPNSTVLSSTSSASVATQPLPTEGKKKPSLLNIIIGFTLVGLAILSLLFYCRIWFKRYQKRAAQRRRERQGVQATSTLPNKPSRTSQAEPVSQSQSKPQLQQESPQRIAPGFLSSSPVVPIQEVDSEDNSSYEGISESEHSDDNDAFAKELRLAAHLDKKAWEDYQKKRQQDQSHGYFTDTSADESPIQSPTPSPTPSTTGRNPPEGGNADADGALAGMEIRDVAGDDDESTDEGFEVTGISSNFLLGPPSPEEEGELENVLSNSSFPYGDEEHDPHSRDPPGPRGSRAVSHRGLNDPSGVRGSLLAIVSPTSDDREEGIEILSPIYQDDDEDSSGDPTIQLIDTITGKSANLSNESPYRNSVSGEMRAGISSTQNEPSLRSPEDFDDEEDEDDETEVENGSFRSLITLEIVKEVQKLSQFVKSYELKRDKEKKRDVERETRGVISGPYGTDFDMSVPSVDYDTLNQSAMSSKKPDTSDDAIVVLGESDSEGTSVSSWTSDAENDSSKAVEEFSTSPETSRNYKEAIEKSNVIQKALLAARERYARNRNDIRGDESDRTASPLAPMPSGQNRQYEGTSTFSPNHAERNFESTRESNTPPYALRANGRNYDGSSERSASPFSSKHLGRNKTVSSTDAPSDVQESSFAWKKAMFSDGSPSNGENVRSPKGFSPKQQSDVAGRFDFSTNQQAVVTSPISPEQPVSVNDEGDISTDGSEDGRPSHGSDDSRLGITPFDAQNVMAAQPDFEASRRRIAARQAAAVPVSRPPPKPLSKPPVTGGRLSSTPLSPIPGTPNTPKGFFRDQPRRNPVDDVSKYGYSERSPEPQDLPQKLVDDGMASPDARELPLSSSRDVGSPRRIPGRLEDHIQARQPNGSSRRIPSKPASNRQRLSTLRHNDAIADAESTVMSSIAHVEEKGPHGEPMTVPSDEEQTRESNLNRPPSPSVRKTIPRQSPSSGFNNIRSMFEAKQPEPIFPSSENWQYAGSKRTKG